MITFVVILIISIVFLTLFVLANATKNSTNLIDGSTDVSGRLLDGDNVKVFQLDGVDHYQIKTEKFAFFHDIKDDHQKIIELFSIVPNPSLSGYGYIPVDVFNDVHAKHIESRKAYETTNIATKYETIHQTKRVCCPKCGSDQIVAQKKGFGVGKAAVGAILVGGIGLAAGAIGSKKIYLVCMSCGHRFNPGNN
ncbi:MAG TPA: hypothetical protein P5531_03745 [Bacteroidales bacterium]|nr:hypothetical protein [Bacteroidales bacterium]